MITCPSGIRESARKVHCSSPSFPSSTKTVLRTCSPGKSPAGQIRLDFVIVRWQRAQIMRRDITLGAIDSLPNGTQMVQWQLLPRANDEDLTQVSAFDFLAVTRAIVEDREGTFIESPRSSN